MSMIMIMDYKMQPFSALLFLNLLIWLRHHGSFLNYCHHVSIHFLHGNPIHWPMKSIGTDWNGAKCEEEDKMWVRQWPDHQGVQWLLKKKLIAWIRPCLHCVDNSFKSNCRVNWEEGQFSKCWWIIVYLHRWLIPLCVKCNSFFVNTR